MNLKKLLVLSPVLIGVGFSIGFGLAYARIIPGVDRPYDPSAYYSQTEVSYADSPSTFALRDLAGQGGSVYDPKRHEKSLIFKDDFISTLQSYVDKTLYMLRNTTPLTPDKINPINQEINIKQEDIVAIYKANAAKAIEESKAFRSSDDYSDKIYDRQAQAKLIDEQYLKLATEVQKAAAVNSKETEAVNMILNNTSNTLGMMEAQQLEAQIIALQEAETAKKTALLSELIQIKNMEHAIERDQNIEANRLNEDNRLHIADPYDREEFIRPKSNGFKNFE